MLIPAGYIVLLTLFVLATGVDYDEISDSTGNIALALVLPVGVGSIILAALTTWLGWWRPAILEPHRRGPRWLLLVPALVVAAIVTNLVVADYDQGTGLLLTLVIGVLLVGFSEELLTRGLAVVAFRSGMREGWVWLASSLVFAALHSVNALLGQPLAPTAQQLAFTFVFGLVFFAIRLIAGTLVVCMVLHAAWDFSVFVGPGSDHAGTGDETSFGIFFAYVAIILVAVGARRLLRREPGAETAASPSTAG